MHRMKKLIPPFKNPLFFIILPFLILGCKTDKDPGTSPETNTDPWTLVFEEEFENLSSWDIWYGGAFNNEIQLYKEEQLSLDNGILTINTQRKSVSGPTNIFDASPKNFEYVSGRIDSKIFFGPSDQNDEREYRFLARLKLPAGNGMWPAFWLFGDPWPTQGEIDILEARGGQAEVFQSNIFYGTEPNININSDTEAVHTIGQNLTEDFHVYEMIWREDSIDIIFDDERIYTYTANNKNNIRNLFGKKQKIVLNTAVGGLFFFNQNSNSYADNASMEIDWVRVYKK